MNELKPWHIIVLVILIFVLFGYKKLPDATRSLGRSLRILKTEVKSLHDDDNETPTAAAAAPDAEPKAKAAPPRAVEAPVKAPRVVESPRAVVPEASVPVTTVKSGAASQNAAASDADQR